MSEIPRGERGEGLIPFCRIHLDPSQPTSPIHNAYLIPFFVFASHRYNEFCLHFQGSEGILALPSLSYPSHSYRV